jgi:hypothetical protein
MASAGPAMEVVGRHNKVLDRRGDEVEPSRYLVLARKTVEEAAAITIDELPLETFDARTRFALFWVRLFARGLAAKSEARWQAMASDLSLSDIHGILTEAEGGKGVRLSFANECPREVTEMCSIIDAAFALADAWQEGVSGAAKILARSGRDADDPHLWAALNYLSSRLPEGDRDRQAWTGIVRARKALHANARRLIGVPEATQKKVQRDDRQSTLFDAEVID